MRTKRRGSLPWGMKHVHVSIKLTLNFSKIYQWFEKLHVHVSQTLKKSSSSDYKTPQNWLKKLCCTSQCFEIRERTVPHVWYILCYFNFGNKSLTSDKTIITYSKKWASFLLVAIVTIRYSGDWQYANGDMTRIRFYNRCIDTVFF